MHLQYTLSPYRSLSADQKHDWDSIRKSSTHGDVSLYQSNQWAEWLSTFLGEEHVFVVFGKDSDGGIRVTSLVVRYPLFHGYCWWYLPRGPLVMVDSDYSVSDGWYASFCRDLACILPSGGVWVRVDPIVPDDERASLEGLSPAHSAFHPKKTLLLDLDMTEEELLGQMTQKGRYNIRLAIKKDVKIALFSWSKVHKKWIMPNVSSVFLEKYPFILSQYQVDDPVVVYDRLAQLTAVRDGFSVHSRIYFERFLKSFGEDAFLLLAYDGDTPLAGGIFVEDGTTTIYYYGASDDAHREKMAPYLVQWTAILLAKEVFSTRIYDFLGIGDGEGDTLSGVTQFKTRFGGRVRSDAGTFEYVLNPLLFHLITLVKKLKKWFRK